MTIHDTELDLFAAWLFRDYLAAPASITAGIPADSSLPKDVMDMGRVPVLPSLLIAAKEQGSVGAMRVIDVSVMLLTWMAATPENEGDPEVAPVAEQTTTGEASAILAPIGRVLRDRAAFKAFLETLELERREDWAIKKIVHNGLAPPMRKKETRTIFYGLTMSVHFFVPQFATAD